MGWLDERVVTHIYKKPDGEEIYLELPISEDPPDKYKGAIRSGFHPDKMNMTIKSSFEMNGRVGYRYSYGDGKSRITSATREKYEHTIGNVGGKKLKQMGTAKNESVYTKGYKEHIKKQKDTKR